MSNHSSNSSPSREFTSEQFNAVFSQLLAHLRNQDEEPLSDDESEEEKNSTDSSTPSGVSTEEESKVKNDEHMKEKLEILKQLLQTHKLMCKAVASFIKK